MCEMPLELSVPAKATYVGTLEDVNRDIQRRDIINACTNALTLRSRINILISLTNVGWWFWMNQMISNITEAPR
jgi:hypothetical protein